MENCKNDKKLYNFKYKMLFLLSLSIYFIYIITAIISSRALYADGSDFYVNIVNNANNYWPYFDDSQRIRLFINILNQLPISIALKLGITSTDILRGLFNAPLFIYNLLGMIVSVWLCFRARKKWIAIFPLSAYVLYVIISEIFIVNPAFLAFWIYYVTFLYLILNLKWKWYDYILILISSFTSFRSHEGILVYGCLIILYYLMNYKKIERLNKYKKYIVILTFCQVLYAVWWQITNPTEEQTKGYINLLTIFLNVENLLKSNIIFSIIGTIFILVLLIYGYKFNERKNKMIYYVALFIFIFLSIIFSGMHIMGIATNPVLEFNYRVLITFGGAGTMFMCIIFDKFKLYSRINVKMCFVTIAILLVIQSTWQLGNNYQWNILKTKVQQYVNNTDKAVSTPDELGLYDKSIVSNNYQWSWTGPVFSIALHDSLKLNSIISPEQYNKKEYFDIDVLKNSVKIPFVSISNNVFNINDFIVKYESQNKYELGRKIEIGENKEAIKYLLYGWSTIEQWGVWSDSKEAEIELFLGNTNLEKDLVFKGSFFGYVDQEPQNVKIYANDKEVGEWNFEQYNQIGEKSIIIPKEIVKDNQVLNITFKISNPISPAYLKLSDDTRNLGIAMHWFCIE